VSRRLNLAESFKEGCYSKSGFADDEDDDDDDDDDKLKRKKEILHFCETCVRLG
jgi:hypothetical protein